MSQVIKLTWGLLWRTIIVLMPAGMAISALLNMWPTLSLGADLEPLKPTIIFIAYAGLFIVADSLFKANPSQLAFGWRLQLTSAEWRELSFGMSALMAVIAAINFVMASVSTVLWANFKLFGIPFFLSIGIATLVRRLEQRRYHATMSRHIEAKVKRP